MQRFTRLYCCAALALGLVSGQTFAGPLASAASDAFRRLPQSAPAPATPANGAAIASPAEPAAPSPIEISSASPDPLSSGSATNDFDPPINVVVQGPSTQQVPEPGVLWLLGAGVLGLALSRRRQK